MIRLPPGSQFAAVRSHHAQLPGHALKIDSLGCFSRQYEEEDILFGRNPRETRSRALVRRRQRDLSLEYVGAVVSSANNSVVRTHRARLFNL